MELNDTMPEGGIINFCPICGHRTEVNAAFSPQCGAQVGPAVANNNHLPQQVVYVPQPVYHAPRKDYTFSVNKWVFAAVGFVIFILICYFVLINLDPDWKSASVQALEAHDFVDSKILTCDVTKGKNVLGWNIAVAEGTFTYGTGYATHTYEITFRHMDNSWYYMFVTVDGVIQ